MLSDYGGIWDLFIYKGSIYETILGLTRELKIKRIAVESSVTYEFYSFLSRNGLEVIPLWSQIESLRLIKDEGEIGLIEKAVKRAEDAFNAILPYVRPGVSEIEVALKLENAIKRAGSKRLPFDIIVASGPNSSMPHAKTTQRRLSKGALVIIDWGAEAGGYFSDMTRTILLNGPDISKKIEIYETVLKANTEAIKNVVHNIMAKKIDEIARKIIKRKRLGEYFGHGTGHGVGLDVHEGPSLSPMSKDKLRPGMVFTIEPGIYIPGLGGVRIEDMVVITPDGSRVLTKISRELKII